MLQFLRFTLLIMTTMFLGIFSLVGILVREMGEILELFGCLEGVRLNVMLTDRWVWNLEGHGLFSSKS